MTGRSSGRLASGAIVLLAVLFCAVNSAAYSVLTHQELIDLAWNDSIRPLLLVRFPNATDEQLREAHAYAYGGSAIQDMGYYPFGKQFFSNLTHYVRSGDFVGWLLANAQTVDEYAFAIGALSHYVGDSIGHSEAVNPATAVEFPELERRFGSMVTYDESPHGHIRTEFAFDIGELADGTFAPPDYLRFIGLKVPRKFLGRAFKNTYGFDIHEVLGGRIRPYEATAYRCVLLSRHSLKPRLYCIGISFLPTPPTGLIAFLPTASLAQTTNGTGDIHTKGLVSRRTCWQFWSSSFRKLGPRPIWQ